MREPGVGEAPSAGAPHLSFSPSKPGPGPARWLLAACAVCARAGVVALLAWASRARTHAAISTAEGHYDAAIGALESATAAIERIGSDTGGTAASEALGQVRAARRRLAAARAAIEQLSASDGKRTYLGSLASADASLDALEDLVLSVRAFTLLADRLTEAGSAARKADALLDEAVRAGNASDYATMRKKARAASRRYAAALAIFEAAHRSEPGAGLAAAVTYVSLRKQQADLAAAMARDAAAGRIQAYNEQVARQRELDRQAERTPEPAIISDPEWFPQRIAGLRGELVERGNEADALRARALELFDYRHE